MYFLRLDWKQLESMLVATALTATSIAITVQVLTELGKMQTKEAQSDIRGCYCRRYSCYSRTCLWLRQWYRQEILAPAIIDITLLILKILGLFAALTYWICIY